MAASHHTHAPSRTSLVQRYAHHHISWSAAKRSSVVEVRARLPLLYLFFYYRRLLLPPLRDVSPEACNAVPSGRLRCVEHLILSALLPLLHTT